MTTIENQRDDKIKKRLFAESENSLFLIFLCIFYIPFIVSCLYLVFVKIITLRQLVSEITSISTIFIIFFHLIFFISDFKFFIRKIEKFDGSKENINSVNSTILIFVLFNIVLCILHGVSINYFIYFILSRDLNFDYQQMTPIIMFVFGSIFIFSLLFTIIFIQKLENQISSIPICDKYVLSLKKRFILTIFFSVIGLFLSCISPFFIDIGSFSNKEIFFQRIFPVAVVSMIIIFIDIYVLINHNVKIVKNINLFSKQLANKNYTMQPLKIISREEFGLMIEQINIFFLETEKIIKKLNANLNSSIKISEILSLQTSEIVSSVNQIDENIENVNKKMINHSSGVDESNRTVDNIISLIDDLNKSILLQNNNIENSSASIQEMIQNITSVSSSLDIVNKAITDLSNKADGGREKIAETVDFTDEVLQKSQDLMNISETIKSIASQTNLLAMNASIEAAHAGDTGRGFSVVANEIRNLADKSLHSGQFITTQLEEIIKLIRRVTAESHEVNKIFETIHESTKSIKNLTNEIDNAMNEQTTANHQVLESMINIKSCSESISNNSAIVFDGCKEISKEMKVLATDTSEVYSSMSEIKVGTKNIFDRIKNLSKNSNSNKIELVALEKEIKKFKVSEDMECVENEE